MYEAVKAIGILIHVPREGHDSKLRHYKILGRNFNPRAPRGAPRFLSSYALRPGFQSSAPRGARRQPMGRLSRRRYFNPRAREGTTTNYYKEIAWRDISIHVPARHD